MEPQNETETVVPLKREKTVVPIKAFAPENVVLQTVKALNNVLPQKVVEPEITEQIERAPEPQKYNISPLMPTPSVSEKPFDIQLLQKDSITLKIVGPGDKIAFRKLRKRANLEI